MEINKDLIAASSTPVVLANLAEEDSYGYAILKEVRELSGSRMEWTDGMLYPVLHRLERLGLVEARWDVAESSRRRKYYQITPSGRSQLAEERRQWEAVDATLRGIWSAIRVPVPPSRPASAALLFAAMLVTFLATLLWTGRGVDTEPDVLIAFDLLLVLVLALLLYSVSARDPRSPAGVFDVLRVVLVVGALLADAIALWVIAARITELGFTLNRMAALGEHVILLLYLVWSAVLCIRFLRGADRLRVSNGDKRIT